MKLDVELSRMMDDLWSLVEKTAKVYECDNKSDKMIQYNKNKDCFKQTYIQLYKEILEKYMKEPGEPLDRHKVAAIFMISVIKANVLSTKVDDDSFTGNYALAMDVGLNYMLDELNIQLESTGKHQAIKSYSFPEAIVCNTPYHRIFYRNLYFTDKNDKWGLNPLDIAEKLFLIEYITLMKQGIDPMDLKEAH